jgi:hypothetical protein
MKHILIATVGVLVILLGACVPAAQQEGEPEVAVINAPEEHRVEGVAASFATRMRELGTPGFDVFRDVALAGVEQRRNLGGSQAIPSAVNIARSFGSTWTLMLGAVDIDRQVEDVGRNERKIVVDLAVEGILVRASDGRVVARITSRTFTGERFAAASEEPLPEVENDPLVRSLAADAAATLAPVFREILASGVSESSSE